MQVIAENLKMNIYLKRLYFTDFPINHVCMKCITDMLMVNTSITELGFTAKKRRTN